MKQFDQRKSVRKNLMNSAVKAALFLFFTIWTITANAATFTVTVSTDAHAVDATVSATAVGGGITLRSALERADFLGGTHTINFAAALNGVPITVTLGQIIFGTQAENITITGSGTANTIIKMTGVGANRQRFFFINDDGLKINVVITVTDIKFQDGWSNPAVDLYGGGAIVAGGGTGNLLSISNCDFTNNITPTDPGGNLGGGAINMQVSGDLTITNCTFTNNDAQDADGGAIWFEVHNAGVADPHYAGHLTITNSTFTGNHTGGNGGAVAYTAQGIGAGQVITDYSVDIEKNTFTGNTATGYGGAISSNNSFGAPNTAVKVLYNRIVNNVSTLSATTSGLLFVHSAGGLDAKNNWWGCNTGPVAAGTCDKASGVGAPAGGVLDVTNWLQLKTTASPNPICNATDGLGNTSTVTTSFLTNSGGTAIPVANLSRLIGLTVTWTATLGTAGAPQELTIQADGEAITTFTSNGTGGNATVNAQVDNVPVADPTARATIIVNTKPTVTLPGNQIICQGGTVMFTSTITGTPTPTIKWYKGATPLTDGVQGSGSTIAGSGTATMTITNVALGDAGTDYNVHASNQCSTGDIISGNATLTVNPTPPTPTITPGGPTTFCSGGSVTLTSSAATGNQWYLNGNPIGGATNPSYNVTAAGSYTVIVTLLGCPSLPSAAVIVIINPTPPTPTIIPGGPTTFCAGGSVNLSSSSATGNQWYLGGNPIGGATNQVYAATASGSYTVVVTSPDGCPSAPSLATTVTVNPIPPTPTITPAGPIGICTGSSVTLTSSAATGNQWYLNGNPIGGATNSTLVVNPPGNYTVIVTLLGCSSAASAPVTVSVNPVPDATITGGGVIVCQGITVTLSGVADPTYTYQWSRTFSVPTFPNLPISTPLGTAQTQQVTSSGIYQLTVTNAFGCTSVSSTVVHVADYVYNGTLAAGDPQQTGRLTRDGIASTCAVPKACPGVFTAVGARFYDAYNITNIRNTPVCATIGFNTGCATNLFPVAYLTTFNPANLCANYLGDPGSSAGAPGPVNSGFYEVTIPANGTIVVVVHEVNAGSGGCGSYTLTVDVPRETPGIVATPAAIVCNGTPITLTASTANTYLWSPGGATTQSIIHNAGAATYTVTLGYGNNGCTATATQAVSVFPTPDATATPPTQTICSGSAITTIALTGTVPGTTFNWTRDNTGNVTGIATPGSGDISGTLTNTTNTPQTVTFTITPTANGCFGVPITATVIVNPIPNAVATPPTQTICTGSAITTILLTGNVAGTVYNWTRDNVVNVTGIATPGIGDISGSLTNTTNIPQTVIFTITPSYTNAGVTCTGTPITATVTVNPIPTVNAVANQVVCQGSPTTANFSGSVPGTVFNWTNNNTAIGLAANGTGNIAFIAANPGVTPITATIVVTPTFTNAGVTCTGTPTTFTITVNPTPSVNAIPNQTVCKGAATAPVNFSGPVPGTVFNWTNNNTSIGLAASGSGNIASFIAINNTLVPVIATITVTPSYTNAGVTCTGPSKTFTITVNPQVSGTITGAANNQICKGQSASVNINLGGVPNFAGVFDIAVISGAGSPGTLQFNANVAGASAVTIPAANLVNNSTTIVIYKISWLALADATGCPEIMNGSVNISVFPTPVAIVSQGPGTACPGSAIVFDVVSPNNMGGTFAWEVSDGISTLGSGNNVAFGQGAVSYQANPCPYNKTLTFTFIPLGVQGCPNGVAVVKTVLVQDITAPSFTVNAALLNTSIECTNTSAITAARNYIPTATDNCSTPSVTESETVVNGCGGAKTYTTVFTATDGCGNVNTVTQVITVTDTTGPVIGTIAPQTLGCSGVIPNYITLLNLAGITTDCGPGVTFQQLPPYAPGTPVTGLSGTITIVIEATDGCGNKSTKTFTVTLTPGAPTAVCKSSSPTIFVNLLPNGTATITPALIDGGSFSSCSSITLSVSPSTFTCANIGVNAVTLTVTDGSGNTAQCTTNVTVRDVTAPVMTACPPNITVTGGPSCTATATWTPPTATDNCGAPTVTGTHTPGQVFNAGTTTVTYTATDASGNSVTCSFTVTVLGSGALGITCPANINANTNAGPGCKASVVTPNPTITGNCGAILTWTITGATNSSGTGNLGTFLFNTGTSVVTYRATDGSGNSVTCSYTVIVTNAVAGAISGTATVQQNAFTTSPVTFTGSGGQSPYTFNYTINGTPQPPITSVGNSAIVSQSNAVLGTFAYQLTAVTDASGCAGTLTPPTTATITVVVAGIPDLIVIPTQSSSQIGPGGTIQEVFTIRNIGTGPTTGPVTFTVNRFAPGSGLTASLNSALSVNIGFDNFTLHNNSEAGWSVVTTASTFTFTYTGVIATGPAGSKNVGITVTRGTGANAGSNGTSNQTATIPGGTGGGESPTSNNSATVTIIKN